MVWSFMIFLEMSELLFSKCATKNYLILNVPDINEYEENEKLL